MERLGLDENEAAYIEAENITRNGDAYVLKITKSSLDKMLSASSYEDKTVPLESIAILDQIERIAQNGVYFGSEGDRKNRAQINGYDYLTTTVYIDGEPYAVDMRVRVEDKGIGGANRLYHFTPETIKVEKKTAGEVSTAGRHATSVHSSEIPPSSETSIHLSVPEVKEPTLPTAEEVRAAYIAELERLEEERLFAELERDWYEGEESPVPDEEKEDGSAPGVYTDKIKWGIHEIDVRPDGKGFWGQRIRQSNPRVEEYELKINPQNESYHLPHPEGGYVQFENMIDSTVQDGKLVMQQKSFYHVNDMPDFAKNKVLEEAKRQMDAARAAEYKVEWLVSDKDAVKQLKEFFNEQNVDIIVTFYPE